MSTQNETLAVVIPVYNETEIIQTVIKDWDTALASIGATYTIHLYNDGSKDNTLEVCRDLEKQYANLCVHDKPNSGHGPTILKGYRDNLDATWLFQTDSDNELPASYFKDLWEKRETHDFLLGLREDRHNPWPRRVISWVSRFCVKTFYGSGVIDVNSPYRLMRVSALHRVFKAIPSDTFAPNVIISGMANYLGLRLYQINVPHRERQTGEVSIKKFKLLKCAIRSFFQTIQFSFSKKKL